MRALFVLFFLALIIPVATGVSDVPDTPTKTTTGAKDEESSVKTADGRETDRDLAFDLYDFFLPHFPSAFLLDKGIFGLERDLFRRTSPRYDIKYNEHDVVMTVEVPGYASEDIEVEVKSGGRVLSVSAQKESRDEEHAFSSHFHQSFTLDPGVETDKLTANLSDGILTLTAPRHSALPYNRKIPITHLDQKMLDEMANEGDKKEDDFAIIEEE